MLENILKSIGLNENEALVYIALLGLGEAGAGMVSEKTSLKRGTVYNTLRSLIQHGLIEEIAKNDKTFFRSKHPSELKNLIKAQEEKLAMAHKTLDGVLQELLSRYNLSFNKPSVQFFEGENGLREIYNDIVKQGKRLSLVRATYDETYSRRFMDWVSRVHVKQRVENNIDTYTISPDDPQANRDKVLDARRRVHRQWVSKNLYNAPVEINIYGDKVAFLSFGKEIIGFVIQSPQIGQAMQQLFDLARRGSRNTSPEEGKRPTGPASS